MIDSENYRSSYNGNDSTNQFAYGFPITEKTDLRVVRTDLANLDHDLVADVDFEVSGIGDSNKANWYITYPISGVKLPTGEKLTIVPSLSITQKTVLGNNEPYDAKVVENALDRQAIVSQQLQEQINRAVKLPVSTSQSSDKILEHVEDLANTCTTKASEAATSEVNAATSEANAAASEVAALTAKNDAETAKTDAEASANAAATSETNAATSETNAANSATAASASETNAAASETNAADSENVATTKAAEALASANAASTSEANAAQSASDAAQYPTPAWLPDTDYLAGRQTHNGGAIYLCAFNHHSGSDFATDLAAGKWSALSGAVPDASTSVKGIVQIADQTEVNAGANSVKPVVPSTLASRLAALNFGYTGFRNRIINGDMCIDQRYVGAVLTPANGDRMLDMWQASATQSSKHSVQQASATPPVGFKKYMRLTSLSAYSVLSTDYVIVSTKIEGQNIADFALGTASAKTFTISFYVRSSLTGQFGACLSNGTGDRNYPFNYTIHSANTWERNSITIAGDTSGTWLVTNGLGMQINFSLGAGSSKIASSSAWGSTAYFGGITGATSLVGVNGATLDITGLQMELGSTATEFENVPIQTQLAQCQRYFFKTFNQSVAPANGTGDFTGSITWNFVSANIGQQTIVFPVEMRATPTVTIFNPRSGGAAGNITDSASDYGGTVTNIATRAAQICHATTDASSNRAYAHITASAEL